MGVVGGCWGVGVLHLGINGYFSVKIDRCIMKTYDQLPGGRLNNKMPSYQYNNSHHKDNRVSQSLLSL